MKSPPKICIAGAIPVAGNLGCQALAYSLVRVFTSTHPDCEISMIYGGPAPGTLSIPVSATKSVVVRVVNFRLSPKARPSEHLLFIAGLAALARIAPRRLRDTLCVRNACLRALSEADFVGDIFGGDSFSDVYGRKLFLYNIAMSAITLLLGRPLVLLPQTYGPFKGGLARCVARFIARRAKRVFARDLSSLEIVRDLVGRADDPSHIQFCPDVALALPAIAAPGARVDPPLPPRQGGCLIGLNINGLLYIGGYTRANMFGLQADYPAFIQSLIARLLEGPGTRLLLIPHSGGNVAQSDQRATREVLESLPPHQKARVHIASGYDNPCGAKHVIAQCDFFIGSRMHACIAALSQHIPCVAIAYSDKFKGVFDSVGVGDMVLDARVLSSEALVQGCLYRWRDRQRFAEPRRLALEKARQQLERCFHQWEAVPAPGPAR